MIASDLRNSVCSLDAVVGTVRPLSFVSYLGCRSAAMHYLSDSNVVICCYE